MGGGPALIGRGVSAGELHQVTALQEFPEQSLRRRATAKKRIGVSYLYRELTDPWQWLSLTAEECARSLAC